LDSKVEMHKDKKIIVGITGASGSCYAYSLLMKLLSLGINPDNIPVIFSKNGKDVFEYELGANAFKEITNNYKVYNNDVFMYPFASGSTSYNSLVVAPCSMGTLARIATGISGDLISRTADVMLKERRQIVLITREAPLNQIHIENMLKVTQAGGIIYPASPSFYSKPKDMNELISTVVDRVLTLCGIENTGYKWMT